MEALNTYKTEKTLAEQMNERLAEMKMTKAEAALKMNYSRAALSQYLNGKYASDPTELEKKVREFLAATGGVAEGQEPENSVPTGAGTLKKKVEFFESRDFVQTIGVCQACQEYMGLGIIVGKSGQGKTHALKKYAELPRVAYIECDDTMACRDLVEAIENGIGLPKGYGGTIWSRVNRIREFFNTNEGFLLIIDEADKLINKYTQKKMEILRGIFDQSNVGIVIAGEPRLETELKGNLARFANRMDFYYKLKGLSKNEVVDYLEGYEVDEAAIKALNKSKELLANYSNNVWSVDETLFNKIKIKPEIITQIKTLLLNQKKEQSQLDDADKVLAQMTKARRGLIKEFYNAAESGKFDKNKCPLCGTNFSDINSAIIETEQFIKNIHTDGIKIIEEIETQIINLFQKEIIPVLKVFLEENKILIKMDDTLSGYKALSVERLQQLLYRVKILEFKSQGIEKFDIEEFSQQYENLLKELQEKEVPNKIIFQEKQVELYKSIHRTYYHNEKPYHTVGELQSKEQYVAKLFNDSLSLQLSTEETQLRKLKRDCEEYKKKAEDMTDAIKILISKYEDANKEYQTQLLNAIKIPLMVYSGRIIQNYPLGLGIRAIIKTNQLVFEAASKSGSDVYNILSTGQLNGLSIALLLSIKNVYGDTKGLDILLIDDPLQTIDDISAISLADLLTQQGIGQIVLSTHEETKAALLRYKFKHAGMSVREQNMQALYMKTVTEE